MAHKYKYYISNIVNMVTYAKGKKTVFILKFLIQTWTQKSRHSAVC